MNRENEIREILLTMTRTEIIELLSELATNGELKRIAQAIPTYKRSKMEAIYNEACAQEIRAKDEMDCAERNYKAFIADTADSHPNCRKGDSIDFTLLFSHMEEDEREMEKGFRDTYTKATRNWKLKRAYMNNRKKLWEKNR